MLVDSHVNLHGERYADDLDDVLSRAESAGVTAMLAISDELASTDEIRAIVGDRPNIWRSVGVHPHHAKDYADLSAETLIKLAEDPKVVGIGECGLDFHYEYSERELQEPVFRAHIAAARETGLPLIIHSRNADDVMASILQEEYAKGPFVPLLHCYTGGPELATVALNMGGYVAFSGIITFKKADDVRAVAAMVPIDRILVETDCPFLAPIPHRGRRNEPAYLPHVADCLAEIKGVSRDEIDRTTTDAFFNLFTRAERPT
ncbi:TatD family hydrolase [Parvularcula sp. LCG005]|uniref:TatD family hydrolase n=1 Tax=Parvularcula sp. LCG005 TaxID=3078805 RepID=UPI002942CDB8|nr:TatD family hydrolase [Parvularcula sp. LCG005]WOI54797.1 TatD family hydrolase [Parvularcula sp. LCG005]